MAKARSRIKMRKVNTVTNYDAELELRGDDIARFFRTPTKFLQSCLRKQGLKWRRVSISKLDPATVRRARAGGAKVVSIKGTWYHVDFGEIDGKKKCEWIFLPKASVVVVLQG